MPIMVPSNTVVDQLNATLIDCLLNVRWLDADNSIEIDGHVFTLLNWSSPEPTTGR